MIYKNKFNGKVATVTKRENGYTWFIIDGIETVLINDVFEASYEVCDGL